MATGLETYKREVLTPLGQDKARRESLLSAVQELERNASSIAYLQLDLPTLFAVPSGALSEDLEAHATALDRVLNKSKGLPSAQALQRLKKLLLDQGQFTSPQFWSAFQERREEARRASLVTAARDVQQSSPLGAIPLTEAHRRFAAYGLGDIESSEVVQALRSVGIDAYPDLDLPDARALDRVRSSWRKVSSDPAISTVFDVLALADGGKVRDARCLSELSMGGTPVTAATVATARARVQQGKDTDLSQNAQKFLADLRAVGDPVALQNVVLASVCERAQTLLSAGHSELRTAEILAADGLDAQESRRIVSACHHSGTPTRRGPDLSTVQDHLAAGELTSAERVLNALPDEEETRSEREAMGARIEEARRKKQDLWDRSRAALSQGRIEEAGQLLRQVTLLDREDEAAEMELEALPPPAPRPVAASENEGVRLNWAEVPNAASYRITRVTETGRGTTTEGTHLADVAQNSYLDLGAPAGEQLRYTVLGVTAAGITSQPGRCVIDHVPAPCGLGASPGLGYVDLTWQLPAQASAVELRLIGPRGTKVRRVAAQGGSRVDDLPPGEPYTFQVSARYESALGPRDSAVAQITTSSLAPARPVTDLEVVPGADQDMLQRVEWSTPPGYQTQLWLAPLGADLRTGGLVSESELVRMGAQLVQTQHRPIGEGRHTAEVPVPERLMSLVPTLVTTQGLLVGVPCGVGRPPEARNIRLQSFADQTRLTFDWPTGERKAVVGWSSSDGARELPVTAAQYRRDGCVRLPGAGDVTGVRVSFVPAVSDARSARTEWHAGGSARAASPDIARVTYDIAITRSLLGRAKAELTIVPPGEQPVEGLGVYLREGHALPSGPDEAQLLQEVALDPGGPPQQRLSLDLGRVRGPFCLRLLSTSGPTVQIIDPPSSHLKG